MKKIFLGKPFHWLMLIALVAFGWFTGADRWHVIQFNNFVFTLMALSAVVVLLVLKTTARDEQVTRDAIPDEEDEESLDKRVGE